MAPFFVFFLIDIGRFYINLYIGLSRLRDPSEQNQTKRFQQDEDTRRSQTKERPRGPRGWNAGCGPMISDHRSGVDPVVSGPSSCHGRVGERKKSRQSGEWSLKPSWLVGGVSGSDNYSTDISD